MKLPLPRSWQAVAGDETEKPYFAKLRDFVAEERRAGTARFRITRPRCPWREEYERDDDERGPRERLRQVGRV